MQSHKAPKGFSLIEIMMAVAIIGVLATLGSVEYEKFTTRAKRTEAFTNLLAIRSSMKAFHAEHDRYANTFNELSFEILGKNKSAPSPTVRKGGRYTYQLATTADGWCATAWGNVDSDPFIDIVVIGNDC